MLPFV